jgi:hypothetical protein
MNADFTPNRYPDEGSEGGSIDRLHAIETMISDAGRYVIPSRDLRPRVIEASRLRYDLRQTRTRLLVACAVAMISVMAGVGFSHRLRRQAAAAAAPGTEARWGGIVSGQSFDDASTSDDPTMMPEERLAEAIAAWRVSVAEKLREKN